MSELEDEPLEKVVDDKDLIEAFNMNEEVEGVVGCQNCDFWGKMTGWIEANDRKVIKFVCPKCRAVEQVKNPEAL